MCNCHSILECCVMFSGVKLSIRSFNLLHVLFDLLLIQIHSERTIFLLFSPQGAY